MKILKRVIAVSILLAVMLFVGCFVYTNNRLNAYPKEVGELENQVFAGKDVWISFTSEKEILYAVGENVITLRIESYEKGVILATDGSEEYRFSVLEDMLYDEREERFLERRGGDG